jgi:hypothetical protein
VIAVTLQNLAQAVHAAFPDPANVIEIHFHGNDLPPGSGTVNDLAVRSGENGLTNRQATR